MTSLVAKANTWRISVTTFWAEKMAPACSLVQWQTLKCGLAPSLGLVLGCHVPLEALVPSQKCAKSGTGLLAATAEGFYWSMPSSQEEDGKEVSTVNIQRFFWRGFIHVITLGCRRDWEIWLLADKHVFTSNSVTMEDGEDGFWWATNSFYHGKWLSWETFLNSWKHLRTALNSWEPLLNSSQLRTQVSSAPWHLVGEGEM